MTTYSFQQAFLRESFNPEEVESNYLSAIRGAAGHLAHSHSLFKGCFFLKLMLPDSALTMFSFEMTHDGRQQAGSDVTPLIYPLMYHLSPPRPPHY